MSLQQKVSQAVAHANKKTHDEGVSVGGAEAALWTTKTFVGALADDEPFVVAVSDTDYVRMGHAEMGAEMRLLCPALGATSAVEKSVERKTSRRGT